MPNWNNNKVEIYGCRNQLDKLMERGVGKDGEFEMNNFYPTPTKDNGEVIDGWYGWRVENWGCKWDMSDVDYDQMDDTVYMDYQTPWGPNIEFWEKIAEEYKDLTISLSYYEGGMCFGGKFEWTDGKLDMKWEITAPDTDMSEDEEGWTEFAEQINSIGFGWAHEYIMEEMAELIEEVA